jgi:hypothetical protein
LLCVLELLFAAVKSTPPIPHPLIFYSFVLPKGGAEFCTSLPTP